MVTGKRSNKWVVVSCILAMFGGILLWGVDIEEGFTPITSFDDRNLKILNDNFRRIKEFVVIESSFNTVIPDGQTRLQIALRKPQPNAEYNVFVQASTNVPVGVLQKTSTGFVVIMNTFTSRTFDWMITR